MLTFNFWSERKYISSNNTFILNQCAATRPFVFGKNCLEIKWSGTSNSTARRNLKGLIIYRNRKSVATLGQTNDLSVICHVLGVLVPFLQFKKREKHPWRKVTYLVSVWMAAKFFLCCLFPCNSETVKAATLAFYSIQ